MIRYPIFLENTFMDKLCRSNLALDSYHVKQGRICQLQQIALLTGLVVLSGTSPSSAAGNVFYCNSSTFELTINMNFGEWFDEKGHGGEARFGKKPNTYQLNYKGTTIAFLTHRGKKSKLIFPDGLALSREVDPSSYPGGSIVSMSCSQGGSGQTPGE